MKIFKNIKVKIKYYKYTNYCYKLAKKYGYDIFQLDDKNFKLNNLIGKFNLIIHLITTRMILREDEDPGREHLGGNDYVVRRSKISIYNEDDLHFYRTRYHYLNSRNNYYLKFQIPFFICSKEEIGVPMLLSLRYKDRTDGFYESLNVSNEQYKYLSKLPKENIIRVIDNLNNIQD